MKSLERLVLTNLSSHIQEKLDPMQFAYKRGRSTVDDVATLLHNVTKHLEKAGNYIRILFIDFSSAFNTIQRLIKYSDDAVAMACRNWSDSFHAYENTVSMISVWCKENFLELNVCKTKELCIDFRTSGQFDEPLYIGGEAVEVTDTFEYRGITFDNKLTFGPHVQGVYKKCQQRL